MRNPLLAIAFVGALPLLAESPTQPWEWTDAERIAAMTDDVAAAERLRVYRESERLAPTITVDGIASSDSTATLYDRIDGKRDPHLFFLPDLFDSLVRMANADEFVTRRASRERYEADLKAIGMPADFWENLEIISAVYRADHKEWAHYAFSQLPQEEKRAGIEVASGRMCRDRRAALREAQERFGPKFNQFLYTAVTRGRFELVLRKPDAEALRRVAAGECK